MVLVCHVFIIAFFNPLISMSDKRAKIIVVEGPDFGFKTQQIIKLQKHLKDMGLKSISISETNVYAMSVLEKVNRECGVWKECAELNTFLRDQHMAMRMFKDIDRSGETGLYEICAISIIRNSSTILLKKCLMHNDYVFLDRWHTSTYVYGHFLRGVDWNLIDIMQREHLKELDIELCLILMLNEEEMKIRSGDIAKEFLFKDVPNGFRSVIKGYEYIIKTGDPMAKHTEVVNASDSQKDVHLNCVKMLEKYFKLKSE